MGQYDEDSAMRVWGQVLLKLLCDGDGESTRRVLQLARAANAFADAYLSRRKKLPKPLPGYYGIGDENEGIMCA